MAGTFAHITLVDSLCQDADALDSIDTLSPTMKRALMQFNNFCELGAVSPDTPYLTLLSADSASARSSAAVPAVHRSRAKSSPTPRLPR